MPSLSPPFGRPQWVTAAWVATIALAGLAGSFVLWDPLDTDEHVHMQRLTEHALASVCSDLDADVRSRLLAQVRLAELWGWEEPGQLLTGLEWTLNSRLFLEHYRSELELQWVDPSYRRRWALRRDGTPDDGTTLDVAVDPAVRALLERTLHGRQPSQLISPAFRLPNGRRGVRIMVPVVRRDIPLGFLVAVSDVQSAVEMMLTDHRGLGYSFSIRDGATEEIYRSPGARAEDEVEWAQEASLPLPGTTWRVRVWPNADLLKEVRSSLPELAAVLGSLLGCALLLTAHFAHTSRQRSRELRQAQAGLEERVRERTVELELTNRNLEAEVGQRRRAELSLSRLSGRLLRLQDDERRRIARELHDSTTQVLSAVSISLERAQQLLVNPADTRLPGLLRSSVEHLDTAMREIRTVSYLLHPPILDELGLEGALRWYAQGFASRSGIDVVVSIPEDVGRLPYDLELTFFRIVQEGLTNIHRHSGSPTAHITLSRDARSAILEIKDQGTGISSAVLDPEGEAVANIGVGIAGMRERVRQLGGTLSIRTSDEGTLISVSLPLPQEIEPARLP